VVKLIYQNKGVRPRRVEKKQQAIMSNKKLKTKGFTATFDKCPICKENIKSALSKHFKADHTEEEIQEAILKDKIGGVPDEEIGQKYGVTFRYIERLITKKKGLNISRLRSAKRIRSLYPKDFREEQNTVWSFKNRGKWATHSGEYRGNWSPYIPRNVILKYSKPGEVVLDYFCGAGTTAVEAKLLGSKGIALDINDAAIELAKKNIDFKIEPGQLSLSDDKRPVQVYEPELLVGNARDLSILSDSSIDLICAHPPYANIIHYTDHKDGDLSFFDVDDFLKEMKVVAKESYRVLKPGRQCAILIGDTRRRKHVIPIGFKLIGVYLDAGFKLKELVIKRQHNCKSTGFWYKNSIKYNFLLLAHEYLAIFEKSKPVGSPSIRQKVLDYGKIVSGFVRPHLKKKLDELETSTVWILPEKNLEERLNRNISDRYSRNKVFKTVSLNIISEDEGNCAAKGAENIDLLFVKPPFLDRGVGADRISLYLQKLGDIVTQ